MPTIAKKAAVRRIPGVSDSGEGSGSTPDENQPPTPDENLLPEGDENATPPDADQDGPPATPETTETAAEPEAVEWEQKHYPGMPQDGIVIGPDDPPGVLYVRGVLVGNQITLTEPVYRGVKPSKSTGLAFNMVYPRGAQIPTEGAIIVK